MIERFSDPASSSFVEYLLSRLEFAHPHSKKSWKYRDYESVGLAIGECRVQFRQCMIGSRLAVQVSRFVSAQLSRMASDDASILELPNEFLDHILLGSMTSELEALRYFPLISTFLMFNYQLENYQRPSMTPSLKR